MDVAAIGLPVFGSSRCPSSRTVNSGDRSLLLVAGWNEVAAATKASTDSNALDRAKSAASTCGIDAPTARAKNAILTRRGERGLTRIEQMGTLRDGRDSPRGRMSWEDHESKR